MNINKLETFITLVQLGSYVETAKALKISQPTVTSHIKYLEREIDTSLVERNGSKYECTPAGVVLLNYANQITDLYHECVRVMGHVRIEERETLRIAATAQGLYILPEITNNIEKAHPSSHISFTITNTGKAIDQLLDNTIDIALIPVSRDTEKNTVLYNYIHVGQDNIYLISKDLTSEDIPKDSMNLEDLKEKKFLLREEGSNTRKLQEEWLKKHGITKNHTTVIGHSEAILRAVSQGIGLSFMSSLTLKSQIYNFNIVPFEDLPYKRDFYIVIRKNEQYNPLLYTFISEVRNFLNLEFTI